MERSIKIFFSYVHEDEDFRQEIEKCLETLRRQGLITMWHDRMIGPGTEWKRAIEYNLNTADIILLLVSRDFIASDFCYSVQVKQAMERHEAEEARVIPIILRPAHWQLTPFGKLQALPTDGVPVVDRKWDRVDYAFFDIEKGLREAVNECSSSSQTHSLPQEPHIAEQVNQYKGPQQPLTGHWPTPQECDIAIKEYVTIAGDKDLKDGRLFMDQFDDLPLIFNAGGYVRIYRVENWIVRCFTEYAPQDIVARYRAIIAYLKPHMSKFPFFVPHTWVDQGISLNGRIWPFVKAPYIPGLALGNFLSRRYPDTYTIGLLAKKWLEIIDQLEGMQVAHGDLDTTNILIHEEFHDLSIRFIDYDNMYVPNLAGFPTIELGHENFQHPFFSLKGRFNAHMDRFSALVIYLSLVAIADDPSLWEKCGADERKLLLGTQDFRQLKQSLSFSLLRQNTHNRVLQKCLKELEASISEIRMPRSLSNILAP